jgi:hypothetical protein
VDAPRSKERTTVYSTNHYVIRPATDGDGEVIRRMVELDGRRTFRGSALIGEVGGAPAAAISLATGRVVADPLQQTERLTQILRMRRGALRSYSRTPSLPERLRAAIRTVPAARPASSS